MPPIGNCASSRLGVIPALQGVGLGNSLGPFQLYGSMILCLAQSGEKGNDKGKTENEVENSQSTDIWWLNTHTHTHSCSTLPLGPFRTCSMDKPTIIIIIIIRPSSEDHRHLALLTGFVLLHTPLPFAHASLGFLLSTCPPPITAAL